MMKKYEFSNELKKTIPQASPLFGSVMRETLANLARAEAMKGEPAAKPMITKRRTMVFVLAAILLAATVAAAATLLARNVFDVTMGDIPQNAAVLTQHNLARETVGHVEISVKEAAYDGISLYILYGIRDLTATEPLGAIDNEIGTRSLRQEDYDRIAELNVGWWLDNLWIDGVKVSMPNMSHMEGLPGEENGEALYYAMFRLDQENLFLSGKDVEIAMPIGEYQDYETLVWDEGTGKLAKPEKGLITFRMDCSGREQVTTTEPNILMEGPNWSAKASRVVYSPLQLYITLKWDVRPEVLEAYISENGDGYYENGIKYWDYDGLEVCGSEIMNLSLVDGEGKPVFENMEGFYGCGGAGNTEAWYTFPYAGKYPEHMFLAPLADGEADMTQAIQLK